MHYWVDIDRPSLGQTVHFAGRNVHGGFSSLHAALRLLFYWSRLSSCTVFPGLRRLGQISSVSLLLYLHVSSGFLRFERPGIWDISAVSVQSLFV